MSDPAWYGVDLYSFAEGILYLQEAGTVAAPDADDEVGYVTDINPTHEAQTEDVQYMHLVGVRQNLNDYSHGLTATIRIPKGPNAARTLLRNAIKNKTRVKATLHKGTVSANAEIDVFDDAIVSLNETGGADGWSNEITLSGAKWTPTEATEPGP